MQDEIAPVGGRQDARLAAPGPFADVFDLAAPRGAIVRAQEAVPQQQEED